jgi:hypothetical protein
MLLLDCRASVLIAQLDFGGEPASPGAGSPLSVAVRKKNARAISNNRISKQRCVVKISERKFALAKKFCVACRRLTRVTQYRTAEITNGVLGYAQADLLEILASMQLAKPDRLHRCQHAQCLSVS